MAAPIRQSIDQEFNEAQYNQNSLLTPKPANTNAAPSGYGVRNVVVDTAKSNVAQPIDKGERNRLKGKKMQADATEGFLGVPQRLVGRSVEKTGKLDKVRLRAKTTGHGVKAVAKINAKIIYTWSTFLYAVQLPLAVISLLAFAAAMTFNGDGLISTIVNGVTEWVAELVLGLELPDWQLLYFIPSFLMMFFALGCYGFALLQFKLGGAHPLFGDTGNVSKQGLFLLGLIGYLVPGLNFFPWIWLWVHAVSKNPT